jgi:uncharacterized protein (TIGR02246 family)
MSTGDDTEFGELLSAWSAAIVANDPAAIDRFVTPDWVLVGATGIFPRGQFLGSVASGELTHSSMSHDVHQVRIYGEVAVVTSRGANTGSFRGTSFRADEWTTDVFVRRDGRWRCTLTHLTPAAVLDGRASSGETPPGP